MNVKMIVGCVIALVLGLVCFPLIQDSITAVETPSVTENFTATENDSTAEVFTLTDTPLAATLVVTVAGATVTPDSVVGSVVTLEVADSDTGDAIVAAYDYTRDMGMMGTIIGMLPIFYLLFLLGIIALGLKKSF